MTLRVYQISASNSAECLKFSSVCHSDGIRMTGWCKCRGLTLDPKSESKIFVQLSDGRTLAWQLEARVGKCRLQFYVADNVVYMTTKLHCSLDHSVVWKSQIYGSLNVKNITRLHVKNHRSRGNSRQVALSRAFFVVFIPTGFDKQWPIPLLSHYHHFSNIALLPKNRLLALISPFQP